MGISKSMIHGWGNYPRIKAQIKSVSEPDQVFDAIKDCNAVIARGNGRSYGDASLSNIVFSTLGLSRIIHFDSSSGMLHAESGVLLKDILDLIVPAGYFLPVVPGTQLITLGGAIAADVHGKNHPSTGSFSNHVLSFELLDSSGRIFYCSPTENRKLFWQTCGGMGLTGIILDAKVQLKKIESAYARVKKKCIVGLENLLQEFLTQDKTGHSVAWIDTTAREQNEFRSIFSSGHHLTANQLSDAFKKNPLERKNSRTLNLPFYFPRFVLSRSTIHIFNYLFFKADSHRADFKDVHLDSFLFSLDSLGDWYRLYGRKGFLQYQLVLPFGQSLAGLSKIFNTIKEYEEIVFLAVLKMFGETDPNTIMSFPMPGFTLALDFKWSDNVLNLLDDLDQIVLQNGGRVYLAKDARMKSGVFKKTYKKVVPQNLYFRSLLSDRLEI